MRPPRRTRQRILAGVTGRWSHGGGTVSGGIWCASAITSTAPKTAAGESTRRFVRARSSSPVAWWCPATAQRAGPQRVAVDPGAALGEMDVQPRCLDVADELMPLDPLVVADGRDDVPVAEGDVAVGTDSARWPWTMHDAAADRVHRGAVRGSDVDPEVEGPRRCPRCAGR